LKFRFSKLKWLIENEKCFLVNQNKNFAHANGYPPKGYSQFIQPLLKNHRVIASEFRPLWRNQNHRNLKSWNNLSDDLIHFLDTQRMKKIIGMGHSMGGTISVLAALKRPDLFEKLILIDPVIFSKRNMWITQIFPNSILKKLIPIAKISAKRRDSWKTKEEVYELWRKKKVFRKFSDQVLKDFINAAVVPDKNGGVTLAFSKEWETQIYVTAPYIFSQMLKLDIPIIAVKGESSNVVTPELWEKWQTAQPLNQFFEIKNTGHLIPFECPKDLAELLLENI